MKKFVLAAALSSATLPAYAATSEAPQMDVTVITQGAAGSMSQSWLVPAIFIGILLLVIGGASSPVPNL